MAGEMPFSRTQEQMEEVTKALEEPAVRRVDRQIYAHKRRRLDATHPVDRKAVDNTMIAALSRLMSLTGDVISFSQRAVIGERKQAIRRISGSSREVRAGKLREKAVQEEIFDRTFKREMRFRETIAKQRQLAAAAKVAEEADRLRAQAAAQPKVDYGAQARDLDAALERDLDIAEEVDRHKRRVSTGRSQERRDIERTARRDGIRAARASIRRGLDVLDSTAEAAVVRRFTFRGE